MPLLLLRSVFVLAPLLRSETREFVELLFHVPPRNPRHRLTKQQKTFCSFFFFPATAEKKHCVISPVKVVSYSLYGARSSAWTSPLSSIPQAASVNTASLAFLVIAFLRQPPTIRPISMVFKAK